jgi:hypothetical protein
MDQKVGISEVSHQEQEMKDETLARGRVLSQLGGISVSSSIGSFWSTGKVSGTPMQNPIVI